MPVLAASAGAEIKQSIALWENEGRYTAGKT